MGKIFPGGLYIVVNLVKELLKIKKWHIERKGRNMIKSWPSTDQKWTISLSGSGISHQSKYVCVDEAHLSKQVSVYYKWNPKDNSIADAFNFLPEE